VLFILLLVVEVFIARSGPRENFKNPERKVRRFGDAGKGLKYMMMGESTGAGQGADYEKGIAVLTTQHLAQTHRVEMLNTSISGATIEQILDDQIKVAQEYKPDIILIAAGANDVINVTPPWKLRSQLEEMIELLIQSNCEMKIVLTASPDMGSPPRLPQPLRWLAGLMTQVVNKVFYSVISNYDLTLAPIAAETGPIFRRDHTLFAEDRFHPNEEGYAVWIPVLNTALDQAIDSQPSHCEMI
jgi:lysophospholipase L1-like esterase